MNDTGSSRPPHVGREGYRKYRLRTRHSGSQIISILRIVVRSDFGTFGLLLLLLLGLVVGFSLTLTERLSDILCRLVGLTVVVDGQLSLAFLGDADNFAAVRIFAGGLRLPLLRVKLNIDDAVVAELILAFSYTDKFAGHVVGLFLLVQRNLAPLVQTLDVAVLVEPVALCLLVTFRCLGLSILIAEFLILLAVRFGIESDIALLDAILKVSIEFSTVGEFYKLLGLMSFYLRGMSFIDMAFLKKSDLKNGYVTYRRRKTGQQLIIGWTKEMQMILDKYPENATDYLLPIIRNPGTNERCTYRNMGYNINHSLKKIAKMVGVQIPLTLYVARHSWASAAKAKGIPLSVISEGMGHDSEATTQIYLASLDTSVVDRANSLILKSL